MWPEPPKPCCWRRLADLVDTVRVEGDVILDLRHRFKCTLVAIAKVHSDNRLTCAIALTLFATGIALSLLLIAAYSRPFTGEISVGPKLLKQVITSESAIAQP